MLGLLMMIGSGAALAADESFITVASTTSTDNSGLFDYLLPKFEEQTGIEVRVVAVGTGQAIALAKNGDADVLFVHHTPSEEDFVAEGHGVERSDVMYNDFVIVGPAADPAGIKGMEEVSAALEKIARNQVVFASRGDDSGTHKKELSLWEEAGVDVQDASGDWYRETGSGMGATLNTASGMNAYALTDRATWLQFGNRGDLEILVEGDTKLFNQYGIILVSPEKHPHIKKDQGQKFVDWILSEEGQALINAYEIEGQQAFFPNAKSG
jgi:tungstate transport system substrate-binding protein